MAPSIKGKRELIVLFLLVGLSACHKRPPAAQNVPSPPPAPQQGAVSETTALAQKIEALKIQVASSNEALKNLPTQTDVKAQAETIQKLGKQLNDLSTSNAALTQSLSSMREQTATQTQSVIAAAQQTQRQAQETAANLAAAAIQKMSFEVTPPRLRPSLADYVPCRFTSANALALKTGYTPGGPTGSPQTILDAAKSAGSGVKDQAAFAKIVNQEPDTATALIKSMAAGVLDPTMAPKLFQAFKDAERNLTTPYDVGCSQGALTWDETRWIFGRQIADNYVAIQVTARNLNGDQEFLIHDLQVAVADFDRHPAQKHPQQANPKEKADQYATSPVGGESSASGCPVDLGTPNDFVAGRDRMLVRGVGQTGQQFTAANVTARVLEAVKDVLGAAALVAGGPSFSPAVHVFSAAAVPGFSKVFPDLSPEQLDRLNDYGFSASSAYKIVIPKNGSVPMTTFLPQKIFADGYRHWGHCDLINFQRSVVVVLGGKHISEETSNGQLSTVTCPSNGGFLDLSKASGDNLQCQISGTALQLLTAVRLKNSDDQNDNKSVDGVPSVSGKTDSGTMQFSVKALTGLTGKHYSAYGESSNGESASNTKISMPPIVTDVKPMQLHLDGTGNECDTTATKACPVTINGNNLDLASEARLVTAADNTPIARTALTGGSATSQTAAFSLGDLTTSGLKQQTDCLLLLATPNGTVFPTGIKVTIIPAAAGK